MAIVPSRVPRTTISADAGPVTEGAAASFTLRLDRAAPAELSVAVAVSENGDALSGTTATSVVFAAGESSKTLAISNGKTFAEDQAIALSVSGAASSADYALSAETLTLAVGASSVTATLTAAEDDVAEPDETATVSASTVTIRANEAPLSRDATLASLTLSGVDIGIFESATTGYSANVPNDPSSTAVEARPSDDGARVVVADAGGSTAGPTRTVTLAEGANEIAATVTAEDGETTQTYSVTVTRASSAIRGARLPDRDIALGRSAMPSGLWSDGSNMWVIANWQTGEVKVYALADGSRQTDLGFSLTGGKGFMSALWSDGETLWAADYKGGRVLAYRLSDGVRQSDQDLGAEALAAAGNTRPSGLWVVDDQAKRLYAYAVPELRSPSAQGLSGTGPGPFDVTVERPERAWGKG